MSFFRRKIRGYETYGESDEHIHKRESLKHKRQEKFKHISESLARGAFNIAKRIVTKSPEQIKREEALSKARNQAYQEEAIHQERIRARNQARQKYAPQRMNVGNPMMDSMFDLGRPIVKKGKKAKSELPLAMRL